MTIAGATSGAQAALCRFNMLPKRVRATWPSYLCSYGSARNSCSCFHKTGIDIDFMPGASGQHCTNQHRDSDGCQFKQFKPACYTATQHTKLSFSAVWPRNTFANCLRGSSTKGLEALFLFPSGQQRVVVRDGLNMLLSLFTTRGRKQRHESMAFLLQRGHR